MISPPPPHRRAGIPARRRPGAPVPRGVGAPYFFYKKTFYKKTFFYKKTGGLKFSGAQFFQGMGGGCSATTPLPVKFQGVWLKILSLKSFLIKKTGPRPPWAPERRDACAPVRRGGDYPIKLGSARTALAQLGSTRASAAQFDPRLQNRFKQLSSTRACAAQFDPRLRSSVRPALAQLSSTRACAARFDPRLRSSARFNPRLRSSVRPALARVGWGVDNKIGVGGDCSWVGGDCSWVGGDCSPRVGSLTTLVTAFVGQMRLGGGGGGGLLGTPPYNFFQSSEGGPHLFGRPFFNWYMRVSFIPNHRDFAFFWMLCCQEILTFPIHFKNQ